MLSDDAFVQSPGNALLNLKTSQEHDNGKKFTILPGGGCIKRLFFIKGRSGEETKNVIPT
jgi:hypothetical protein